MNLRFRIALLFTTVLFAMAGQVGADQASEPPQEAAKTSLKNRSFPWYDSTADRYKPLRPPRELPEFNWLPSLNLSLLAPLVKILMWTMLAALVVILLVVILRSLLNLDWIPESSQTPGEATVQMETLEALPEPARGVSDLLGEATRLAAESSYGLAIIFYYSWQLVQLNQRQLIEVQKGKTNRQYAREVQANVPVLLDLFRKSTRLFEDAFFGDLPVSQQDFQEVWDQRDKLTRRIVKAVR